jgi:Ice-binding-like
MSNHLDFTRGRSALVAIAVCLVFAAIPVAVAKASPVGLATAQSFVVLGGSTVTNTGPSVLNGDLGVSPGTSLTGFGLPAVVNGATHDNDAVAAQAQSDLTTAYGVAAGQPIPPGNVLTGQDLGGLSLSPGAYGFSSSAQLTGQLTLNAHGDPNAQFVFVIGTTLTTASASSVLLTNGASPCNVYWKIGSSATLGSGTAFTGNLMAQAEISLNDAVTVQGRLLAHGQISLINDVLNKPECATPTTPAPGGTATGGGGSTPTSTAKGKKNGTTNKKGKKTGGNSTTGTATLTRGKKTASGVRAAVTGKDIKKVTFTVGGEKIGGPGSPHQVRVPATPGTHVLIAHVTFKHGTSAKTLKFTFRVPVPVLHPHHGPSQFTG